MEKNLDATSEDSNLNADILLDTTPRVTDTIKTWMQVFEILEHEIINCLEYSIEEDDDSYATNIRHITQSKLHKIVAWSRIIPYNDVISWALDHVDIQTRSIINHQQVVIGSF
jgi:hypothetical protein